MPTISHPSEAEATFELQTLSNMDRIRSMFRPKPDYEPLLRNDTGGDDESIQDDLDVGGDGDGTASESPFSWIEYMIFFLLGIAMLWAWNMFLAAAPYFQHRFRSNDWIFNHFQPAEISVSTVTNLTSMLILTKLQKGASYPKRISSSLIINTIIFAILALSTVVRVSAGVYFGFLLVAIFCASFSTGLIQNGLFSFASGFGRSEYTQAIMTGQAVAGVLPVVAQIVSVAAFPAKESEETPTSALVYFLAATGISVLSLLAFLYLLRRHGNHQSLKAVKRSTLHGSSEGDALTGNVRISGSQEDWDANERPSVSLTTLFMRMPFLAAAVFVCFAVTMFFPVFSVSIESVRGVAPAIFIPTAFLFWNVGDLFGRLSTLWKPISLTHYPFALFCLAMARLLFIPLYFLCNIKGKGAVVNSDVFYLVIVQFLFGLTNGYLGSECMMGAGEWVLPEEREAAGGFMGLMLVGGLTVGSLLSFLLGDL